MKAQRVPFLPVTTDVDDDKLERLAQEKGVGSLVKPTANKNRAGEGATMPADPSTFEGEEPIHRNTAQPDEDRQPRIA
jgi:hypothetical protein